MALAKSLFVGGTSSHAGKSWMVTAICRYLRNRGVRVAPFKAQNMSNNSYVAVNGGEIGRAQAAQAEACGLEPHTDMNPILLKPHSEQGSQVILHGQVWRDLQARAYFEHHEWLFEQVLDSYRRLSEQYDFIVIEGAGSVAEVNLWDRDLVNLPLARRINSPALLVSDINRGGVFASLIGTMQLLPAQDRELVRSFCVNRFRGDCSLFADGVAFLENAMQRPCLGVMPFALDIRLQSEDGVSLDEESPGQSEVAAIHLPHISNITDFDALEVEWISKPNRRLYSHVLLPGTKNTTYDLEWLRKVGLDRWIEQQHAAGACIVGICGGYQMLGERVIEGDLEFTGLGYLPVSTRMQPQKTVERVRAHTLAGEVFDAYEIHMGLTQSNVPDPFASIDGRPEGARVGRCWGTYLHGALESPAVLKQLGLQHVDHGSRDRQYDLMAQWFEQNADIPLFEQLYL